VRNLECTRTSAFSDAAEADDEVKDEEGEGEGEENVGGVDGNEDTSCTISVVLALSICNSCKFALTKGRPGYGKSSFPSSYYQFFLCFCPHGATLYLVHITHATTYRYISDEEAFWPWS
jgi:hypothetical protein